MTLQAVTFDFWHTLCAPLDHVTRGYRAERLEALACEEAGTEVSDDLALGLAGAAAAREAHTRTWLAGEADHWDSTADAVAQALGLPTGVPRLRAAIEEILASFPGDHVPELTPGVADAVRALADRGLRLAVICDVGLVPSAELRRCLDHHGLLAAFAHTTFSDEVGAFKPDPRMFADALGGLGGVAPDRAAHVGDLRRTDVAGSRAAGMLAVRYTGSNDDPGSAEDGSDTVEGDRVVPHHDRLLEALGLSS